MPYRGRTGDDGSASDGCVARGIQISNVVLPLAMSMGVQISNVVLPLAVQFFRMMKCSF